MNSVFIYARTFLGIPTDCNFAIGARPGSFMAPVVSLLAKDGMTVTDIVEVTQYLTRAEDIKAYAAVRTRFLGDHRPASMLLVIPKLVWLELLVEVEIVAARAL